MAIPGFPLLSISAAGPKGALSVSPGRPLCPSLALSLRASSLLFSALSSNPSRPLSSLDAQASGALLSCAAPPALCRSRSRSSLRCCSASLRRSRFYRQSLLFFKPFSRSSSRARCSRSSSRAWRSRSSSSSCRSRSSSRAWRSFDSESVFCGSEAGT